MRYHAYRWNRRLRRLAGITVWMTVGALVSVSLMPLFPSGLHGLVDKAQQQAINLKNRLRGEFEPSIVSQSTESQLANVTIEALWPVEEQGGRIETYQCDVVSGCRNYDSITVVAKVNPRHISAGTTYHAILSSSDGFSLDVEEISWSANELSGPDPNERDVRKIAEAEGLLVKTVFLKGPLTDKAVHSLVTEYNERWDKGRQRHAEDRAKEYQRNPALAVTRYQPFVFSERDIHETVTRHLNVEVVDSKRLQELMR